MWKSITAGVAVLALGLGAGAYYAHLHPYESGPGQVHATPEGTSPSCSPDQVPSACPAASSSCPACQGPVTDGPECATCPQAGATAAGDARTKGAEGTAGPAAPEE
jgi:hypothetical protein